MTPLTCSAQRCPTCGPSGPRRPPQNIVLLGALVKSIELTGVDWEELVARYVPAKAKELNLAAFLAGFNM